MAMKNSLNDREYDKFFDCAVVPGIPLVRTSGNTEATRWRHAFATLNFATTTPTTPYTIFTVTGLIKCKLYVYCSGDLVGGTNASLGGSLNSATDIVSATGISGIDAGELWIDSSPASIELSTAAAERLVAGNIILSKSGTDITAGILNFDLVWLPISANGNVS